jgi:hypothetical protein
MQHPPKYRISNLSNIAKPTNFARLQVASLINHSKKLLKKNQITWYTKYVTYWLAAFTNYQ